MKFSDIYFYTAFAFWLLWFLYMAGFFRSVGNVYFRISRYFEPREPKPKKWVDPEAITELVKLWSARDSMPGTWFGVAREVKEDGEKDVVVEDRDGFVVVEKEA